MKYVCELFISNQSLRYSQKKIVNNFDMTKFLLNTCT